MEMELNQATKAFEKKEEMFAADSQIQELSVKEIEEVNGGRLGVWLAFEFLSLDNAYAVCSYMNW